MEASPPIKMRISAAVSAARLEDVAARYLTRVRGMRIRSRTLVWWLRREEPVEEAPIAGECDAEVFG
jgi:hypothetical protein